MADKSAIEWTDATWNPIVGCSIVSPGCTNCYAMGMAGRIEAMTAALRKEGKTGAPHYDGTTKKVNGKSRGGERSEQGSKSVWTGKLRQAPEAILLEPLAWKRPRKIFVNSMGDLFHEDVPDEWIDQTFAVMAVTPHHTYQPLTKRADRARRYLSDPATKRRIYDIACSLVIEREIQVVLIAPGMDERQAPPGPRVFLDQWPLPNVWLGVSAERQQEADERIPELLATPAAIRFVSAEPLLGPIDFHKYLLGFPAGYPAACACGHGHGFDRCPNFGKVARACHMRGCDCKQFRKAVGSDGLHWIIAGGESGPNARPMHPAWPRAIRDQCAAAGVPFFFKQWGAWLPGENLMLRRPVEHATWQDGETGRHSSCRDDRDTPEWRHYEPGGPGTPGAFGIRIGKKAAGRLLDGVEHNGFPGIGGEVPAL